MPSRLTGSQTRHDNRPLWCQIVQVHARIGNRIDRRMLPRARVILAVSLGLLAGGIWRVDGALGAMGVCGLLLIALAWWIGGMNLKGLSVCIDAPHRAICGATYPLRVTVGNDRGWMDAVAIAMNIALPGKAMSAFAFDSIGARSAVDSDCHATPATRAVGNGIDIAVTSDFPLGLFGFQAATRIPHDMCVLPSSRVPGESPGDGVVLDTSPQAGATVGAFEGDLRGLRGWRGGDNPRQIAWPATLRAIARGSGPIVRETDPPGFLPEECLIVLHSFSSGGALIHPERFDRALEVATGWIERLRALGIRASVAADFDAWEPRPAGTREEIIRCRERFARAKRRASTQAHELQQALSRMVRDGGAVVLVSDMPPDVWVDDVPKLSSDPVISNLQSR